MPSKLPRFFALFEMKIVDIVNSFMLDAMDDAMLHTMRAKILKFTKRIMMTGSNHISPEGAEWLTNQYFKVVKVKAADGHEYTINERVIFNDYSLSELPEHDVRLMNNLFCDSTVVGSVLDKEMTRRFSA